MISSFLQGVKYGLSLFCLLIFLCQITFSQLIITEAYIDGTDEWIEISNLSGPDFFGSLTIVGAKASTINLLGISIPTGVSRIFGDTMTMITDTSVIGASGLAMSMADTSALNLSIISSGETLDTFVVSAGDVVTYDNTKTSFARVYDNGILQTTSIVPTCSGSVYNVNSSFTANPGIIGSICTVVSTGDNSTGSTLTGDTNTGSLVTGDNTSGSILSGGTYLSSGALMITEIHAKTSGCLDEYIVITSQIAYQGMIDIYGLGTSTNTVTLDINVQTGDQIIVADTTTGFVEQAGAIIVPSMTLTDGGEQLQILISGQVVDNVNYLGSSEGQSFVFSHEQDGVRHFTMLISPSITITCPDTGGSSISSGSTFVPFTGGFGYCDIHLLNSTDLGSGVYSVYLSVSGQMSSLCTSDSQWIVNGVVLQTNNCNLNLETIPGIQQIQFIQSSGGSLYCQDEFIINSLLNSTMSTGSVNICPLNTGNTNSKPLCADNFDCSIRLQHSDMFMFGNSINLVAQANGSDIANSSTSYECMRSGMLLTGCNPSYFQYLLPGLYPLDLTITRNDGQICRTHIDINYPGEMPPSTTGSNQTGMSCMIRFQNTGPYDIGDSINVITQVDNVDILSTSTYTCVRSNSGGLILTGCNPGYFHYDSGDLYDLNVHVTRNTDGSSCDTSTSIPVGIFMTGSNTSGTALDRSCSTRFQNSGPYYPGSSINIVGQVNLTDLTNSTSTHSCLWIGSGSTLLTGCNPGYFSIATPGDHPFTLHITKSDGTSCQTHTNITILNNPTTISSSSNYSSSSSLSTSSGQPQSLSCNIRFQNPGSYSLGDKINLIAQQNQTDIQNSHTSYTCLWTLGNGQTLNQCNPGYFSYSGAGTYQLVLKIVDRYGQTCQSDEYLIIEPKIGSSDEQIYLQQSSEDVEEHSGSDVGSQVGLSSPPIDLKCVITNPIGSDTKKESVSLFLPYGEDIDLTKYRLVVAGKNKLLSGILYSGQQLDIYNSRGLSNSKSGCISIAKDETIIDTLCYPVLQEGEQYCEGIERTNSTTGTVTKKITTSIKKDQIEKLKASCQKKIDRLQLSKDKMKARYEKRILSSKKQTATVRANYAKYRSKVKTRVDQFKGEMYLYKNYTTLLNAELNKNRSAVIDHSDPIRHYMELLAQGKEMIKQKRTMVSVGPCQTLPYYKLKDIIKAEYRIGEYYMWKGLWYTMPLQYQGILADVVASQTGFTHSGCVQWGNMESPSPQYNTPSSLVSKSSLTQKTATSQATVVIGGEEIDQEEGKDEQGSNNVIDDFVIPESGLVISTELIQTQEIMP